MGIRLALTVQPGETIDQAGNHKFSGAVYYLRAFWNWNCARTDLGDSTVAHNYDRILYVFGGVALVCNVDNGATSEH